MFRIFMSSERLFLLNQARVGHSSIKQRYQGDFGQDHARREDDRCPVKPKVVGRRVQDLIRCLCQLLSSRVGNLVNFIRQVDSMFTQEVPMQVSANQRLPINFNVRGFRPVSYISCDNSVPTSCVCTQQYKLHPIRDVTVSTNNHRLHVLGWEDLTRY